MQRLAEMTSPPAERVVTDCGVSMIYEPLVKGAGGILPGGQAGWFMFWRVGAQLSTVNAFRVRKGL
jgi:hypothetical protein